MTGQPVTVGHGGAPAVARQGDDDNPYLRAAIQRHLAEQYQLHLGQDLVSSLAPPLPPAGATPTPLGSSTSLLPPPPPVNPLTFKPPGPTPKPKPKADDDDLPGSELIYPGMRKIKPGSPDDILKAVSKVPEVDALKTAGGEKAQHDFGKLSTPEKALLAGYGALFAGTAAGIGYGTKDQTLSKGLLGGVGALGGPLIGAGLHKLGLPLDADLSLFSNLGKPTPPKPDFPTVPRSLPGFGDEGQGFLLNLKGKF